MGTRTYQVTLATTATLIWWYSADRETIVLRNDSGSTIYHSPDGGLTSGNGSIMPTATSRTWGQEEGDDVNMPRYGLVASGTAVVSVEEHV